MLALGVSASDLSVLLGQALAGVALAVPFGTVLAVTQDSAGRGTAPWPWTRRRTRVRCPHGHPASASHQAQRERRDQDATTVPQRTRDALYAALLRRAAPVVYLFATAPPGGEREAAYQALVRLAVAASRTLPPGTPTTPGALYRDLLRGVAGVSAFDTRVCAELDQRDAAHLLGTPW